MGMGSAPCHAWTISLDGLKAICPEEVKACEAMLEQSGYDWDSFALAVEQEQFDDADSENGQCLGEAASGIQQGDQGWQVPSGIGHRPLLQRRRRPIRRFGAGCYFTVDNVTQFTAAGEKFHAHLEEKSWTVFG